ncbi:unnamed protein product [Closterium sp. NIES-65]|nr:unnamed protein product [Closterium sp. NIES-65]
MARMSGAARLLSVRVVYGLLLALVLFAALHVDALRQASPTGRPSRDLMLKEIKVATSVVKQKPGYKRVATLIQVGLPKAPKKYDITRLYNGTLLAGNDNAVKVLLKKIDVAKPGDLDKVFGMLQQMTLKGRFNDTVLKRKPMVNFPTNGGQLPTREQMLAEVAKAMAVVKKNPNYTKIASIGKTLPPKKYNVRQAYNSKILVGSNDAITSPAS